MRSLLASLALAMVLGPGAPRRAAAAPCTPSRARCSCEVQPADDPALAATYRRYGEVVARGRVLRVGPDPLGRRLPSRRGVPSDTLGPPILAWILVEATWQGDVPDTVAVVQHATARHVSGCEVAFEVDATYLLVLTARPQGVYQTSYCWGTARLSARPRLMAALGVAVSKPARSSPP